jgi:N-acetylmuramoyl-L-alanine amidase
MWKAVRSVCLCVLCAFVVSVAPAWAASSRPDRALYEEAKAAHATLKASAKTQVKRAEWEKVVMRYRRIVARYPQSGYCDDALLAVGDLYQQMATRFKAQRYGDDAVTAYRTLVEEYPSSRLGEQALYSVFEIAQQSGERKRLADAGRRYLDAFSDAPRAAKVKAALKRRAPAQAASLPSPPPPGLVRVFNLRFWSGDASTRVVIDVERQVAVKHDRISKPDRLWIDLVGTRLHPNLKDRSFPVGDGMLEQVRIGQNRDDVVRIVLDFKDVKEYSVVYLQDPTRLLIDVRGSAAPAVASLEKPALAPTPAPVEEKPQSLPARRLPALLAPPDPPAPAAGPPARKGPTPVTIEPPEPSRRAAASGAPNGPAANRTARSEPPPPPQPPQANRAGSYSLARQLGLGARKIVIDAGHGGHDPGAIGRGGLQEKDLVLDVALRVERLVRSELGADVVMTRASDVFIPLEERTAIANSKGADLFLSIHANSSRNPTARGIETYFLNFAQNPHAEEVAARENAISPATLKDLQGLVKAIALNSKIDESKDFAASVQEALVSSLRPDYRIQDRGVHTGPFYVLIGANMPSVLAEIAFVSNPEDERLLKGQEYRERIAASLFEGVRAYLDSLNRTQSRQLTATGTGSTVPAREGRR